MKQIKSLILLMTMLLVCTDALAYDIEAVNAGQTIYYNRIDGTRLEVTNNGSDTYSGVLVIPDTVKYEGKKYAVTRIGMQAFYCSNYLTDINLPETIDSIAPYAFCMSGLKSFVFPTKVKYVTACVFHSCLSLESVTFNEDIVSIEGAAFYNCFKLTELNIPDKVSVIRGQAFMKCNGLTKVTIGKSVKTIGDQVFNSCSNVKELIFNEGIEIIPNLGIVPSSITKIVIPQSVRTIADDALMNFVNLATVDLPNLEVIGSNGFAMSGLTDFTFTNNIKSIGESAFMGCNGIEELSLPKTIDYIGENAFSCMGGLKKVEVYWKTPLNIPANTFNYVSSDAVLYVPYGTSVAYKTATGWSTFKNIVERPFIPVDSIAINQCDTILDLGHTMRLFVTQILPSNASDPEYEWTCSDASVASLGADSVVTAHKVGLAVFTAKAKYNPDTLTVVATCSLTVKFTPVDTLILNRTSGTVVLGDTLHLFVDKVLPMDASNKDYEWTCSADDIAELGADGVVTTKALGEVTFTATAKDGSGKTVACTLTVGDYNLLVKKTADGDADKFCINSGAALTINDTVYSLTSIKEVDDVDVTYQRKFTSTTTWYPWYLPVSFIPSADLLQNFQFAKLAGTYTDIEDNSFNISIAMLESTDRINANTPYFVKAKTANSEQQQLLLADATLMPSVERTLRMSTAEQYVDVSGIYTRMKATVDDYNLYAFGLNGYVKVLESSTKSVGALRLLIRLIDREDNMYQHSTPQEIKIKLVGSDDATGIETINAESGDAQVYDLSGRKVVNPTKGIFIVNGKKVYIK